ncbi:MULTISPECIES: DUF4493 domain-containing protein [Bacteroides]|jgi:hypothetical protein|uniref:DUF4493 domain-containing protein n=1 Tax=Bacteroides TaxID=816 RepID=UPI00117F99F5|nr:MULTISPECIES: DUF4493 domain-containing protein [Bacteroides]
MRNAYYILVFLTYVLLNGCTETERLDGEGILRMKVNVDSSIKVVTSRTVTDDEQAELEKNCEVRLYNGKGLIRYYKGLSEVPEELQLKSGAYNVKVTAGDSVPASFDKTYYKGMVPFEITNGTVTEQNVKCSIANVLSTVSFSDNVNELFKNYTMTVYTKFGSLDFTQENVGAIGYYMLSEGDSSLKWKFTGVLQNEKEFEKEGEVLAESATHYTFKLNFVDDIEDGGASLQVTVDETPLETIEDEVEVKQRPSFRGVGFDFGTPYIYALNAASELSFKIAVTSALTEATLACDKLTEWGFSGNTLQLANLGEDEISALAANGLQIVSAFDETTKAGVLTLTLTSSLVGKMTTAETSYAFALSAIDAEGLSNTGILSIVVSNASVLTKDVVVGDVWSSRAELRGEIIHETTEPLSFNYRKKGESNWTNVEAVKGEDGVTFTTKLTGLEDGTEYQYQALAGNTPSAVVCSFTTEEAAQLPNSGFENWSGSSPLWVYGEGEAMFWDSGNKGSSKMNINVTTYIDRVGLNGGKRAAQLKSQFVSFLGIGKFAAGNLFTGKFVGVEDGTQGILDFGREFASRPSELSIWYRATLGTIDYSETVDAPKGIQDTAIVYVALTDWDKPIVVHTKDKTTLFSKDDSKIIAYGELIIDGNVNAWTEHKIKLEYRRKDVKPKYILVVASASKYGDYYTGSTGSTMWLDDLELIYE